MPNVHISEHPLVAHKLTKLRDVNTSPKKFRELVREISALQRATDRFYEQNEDLSAVKPTVGAVANQIADRHPEWSVEKIMEESAKSTRKLLRLPDPKAEKPKPSRRKKRVDPSFAKSKGGSSRTKPKLKTSKLQSQIDELLED